MNASPSYWSFFAEHRAEMLGATADHMMLVVIAMLIAMAIALPLGMLIVERPALRALSMGIANIFQTIPSLALFGLLIPIPFIGGIGRRTRSEEHTSELQSRLHLVCRLLLEKKTFRNCPGSFLLHVH